MKLLKVSVILFGFSILAAWLGVQGPSALAGGESKKKAGEKNEMPKFSHPEAEWINESLKELLDGKISFDKEEYVTITYDLQTKKEEFQDDFRPPISARRSEPFRWSIVQEEMFVGSDQGIRISDRGMSVLKLWFKDDLEATMEFLQGINWSKRQICAIIFQNKKRQAIGNNYGGQCALFSGMSLKGGVPPQTQPVPFNDTVKIGLRVKDEKFEALWNGRVRSSYKYPKSSFSSGRVGMLWGGSLAGTITSFTVKGKVDYDAMAKELRKGRKK